MKWILVMAAGVLGLVGCMHRPSVSQDVVRLLWNSDGKPEMGITILPEEEAQTGVPYYFSPEAKAQRTSDSSGIVRLDLREYLWSDGKYRFHLFKGGEDLGTETVPKKGFDGVISDLSEYLPHFYDEGAGPPNI
jgi:hypothetical protein